MKSQHSRKAGSWPRKVKFGRVSVAIYRRLTPSGNFAFKVPNYANGKRRFECYPTEAEAIEAAETLARRESQRDVKASQMTEKQAEDFSRAADFLEPHKLSLTATAIAVDECLKMVGTLPSILEACRFFAARHKTTTAKRVKEAVSEFLAERASLGASVRYLEDLRSRLNRFAEDFQRDTCKVTTAEISAWLQAQQLKPQNYANHRRVLHCFFEFAVEKAYAVDNPITGVKKVKLRGGEIEIFTPTEIARLLTVASPEFLPCLAIGAFAGLRSAEIERIEWSDVDLPGRHIVVGASRAKTAARRIVPLNENLAHWLAPYAHQTGLIWKGGHERYYDAQQATAAATEVKTDVAKGVAGKAPVRWKSNALRHSYASYRFSLVGDAGRVAGELGNSASVIHRHYRQIVKPADAQRWFAIVPYQADNVAPLSRYQNA